MEKASLVLQFAFLLFAAREGGIEGDVVEFATAACLI